MTRYIETKVYLDGRGWTVMAGLTAVVRDLKRGELFEVTVPPIYLLERNAYRAARVMRRYFKAHQRFPDVRLPWDEWGRLGGIPRRADHHQRIQSAPARSAVAA